MNVVPEKLSKCKCENVKFLEIDSMQIRYQSEYIALAQWIYFLHKWVIAGFQEDFMKGG